MKRCLIFLLLLVVAFATISCSPSGKRASRVSPPEDLTALARRFVDAMAEGNFDLAGKNFTRKMKKGLPAEELRSDWEDAIKKRGAYKGQIGVRAEKSGSMIAVFVKCDFEEKDRIYKVVFNSRKKICDLLYLAPAEDVRYEPITDTE